MLKNEKRRASAGFGWGIVATLIMTVFMYVGIVTGISPIPQPVPVVAIEKLSGGYFPKEVVLLLAGLSHMLYGGIWGAVIAVVADPVTVPRALAMAAGLWNIMQVIFLPLLGWGTFGLEQGPYIAIATLVFHLIYGGAFGVLMDHHRLSHNPAAG